MFHKAVDLEFNEGTELEVTFQDGKVISFDMSTLFDKYPQLVALNDRELFTSGKLIGYYGIIWNDDLDIEVETIYEEGKIIRIKRPEVSHAAGMAVAEARARKGITQKELAELTDIDQSDISKIERGTANPSIGTLNRIAEALDSKLTILIE